MRVLNDLGDMSRQQQTAFGASFDAVMIEVGVEEEDFRG